MSDVLGIDPSLTATGLAHPDGGLLTVKYPKTVTGDKRLDYLHTTVKLAAGQMHTEGLIIIEDFLNKTFAAAVAGMVHGVVRLACIKVNRPYLTVPPTTLKKFATGSGNATKPDMRMAWFTRTGADVRDDNQVDAAWLRELGLHVLGSPERMKLPKAQTDALKKLPAVAA